jgi:hypothetical protein
MSMQLISRYPISLLMQLTYCAIIVKGIKLADIIRYLDETTNAAHEALLVDKISKLKLKSGYSRPSGSNPLAFVEVGIVSILTVPYCLLLFISISTIS